MTTTQEMLNSLDDLVLKIQFRGMSKEQVLDLTRIARRLTMDAERRTMELKGVGLWP